MIRQEFDETAVIGLSRFCKIGCRRKEAQKAQAICISIPLRRFFRFAHFVPLCGHYIGSSSRYPTPCTVLIQRGWSGSGSSLARRLAMWLSTVRVVGNAV